MLTAFPSVPRLLKHGRAPQVPVGMVTGAMAQIAVFSLQYSSAGTVVTQRFWHSNVIRGASPGTQTQHSSLGFLYELVS